jgi:glucose/arabinose dehydrogenase
MPYLAAALLILMMLALPSGAFAQAGVSYQVPADNPFVGQAGAAPEVYALGLRNPYRFSFDRQNGDLLIGDVGGAQREEVDWITATAARGANFGWPCREGSVAGPGDDECPAPGAIEPLFDYPTSSPDAVTGGFVVRDPGIPDPLFGRYLYADHYTGEIFSLRLAFGDPDNTTTGETIPTLASFGEDASGRLYAVNRLDGTLRRLVPGPTPGTLDKEELTGPFSLPIAIGTYPGDANRLFVGEQGGKVRLVVDGAVRTTPFLEVAPSWGVNSERGLLSVVAAPDYPSSGKIYVYYTDLGGDIRIEEFIRSTVNPEVADPSSRRTVLVIEHSSAANHNGGQMHFGADGCMWITTGDGGGATGHQNNPQNPATLLGKVLRIDPEPPGPGRPECVESQGLPGPGGGVDTTAPTVFASAPRRQRVLRQRGAFVFVSCSEHCSLNAGGTLVIGRRRLLLRRVPAALAGGSRTRLLVRARPRARRLLRTALLRGRRPRIELRVHASDAAGNRSPVVRRSLRARR